jgi:hypothetical protein
MHISLVYREVGDTFNRTCDVSDKQGGLQSPQDALRRERSEKKKLPAVLVSLG